ncbi:MAG: matrixin family metalloprotease [Levilactobacillus sp.]|uniref:matrixin family metalloprotease n=1 Tax=Levilactobacillus sp. TaxID=2767919 RepID=UPI00258F0CDE|nr:matrixin family metalloprotease [Levilactobacillus sp.]MCH4123501.1 matrixin family metalloprotease [Levilactobacillus sp.]MCI1552361.1 matrixin family metalloprotease [Levilactobacillus sp.]MCI1598679.1 matrixin family metalloprotease [Levilactobacillus sp.]MCI1606041.1 matrixin family metalloprotease [Levilactobacillus sp.]
MKRWHHWWLLIVLGIGLVVSGWGQSLATVALRQDRWVNHLAMWIDSPHAQTPIDAVARAHPLQPTYHYYFANAEAREFRQVFEQAVAIFNQTGIVRLLPGSAADHHNTVRFFTYRDSALKHSAVAELGKGGPHIIRRPSWQMPTVNHAQAGLNLAHPELRIRLSVAVHEIGHAVGLAHSDNPKSVMTAMDQEQEHLTAPDLAALRLLYRSF